MEQAVKELEKLNEKADRIIGIMQKPEKKYIKALEVAALVITVASLLTVIDVIRDWLGY